MEWYDIAIIGAGIAGASIASELAGPTARVVLLEAESFPGHHATGRSAAIFSEAYGNAVVGNFTTASRTFFEKPPEGFVSSPLLSPRGGLVLARSDQIERLGRERKGATARLVGHDETRALVPALRDGYAEGAIYDPDMQDIDVDGLHQGFLRLAKARGAAIATEAEVTGLRRSAAEWRLETSIGPMAASIVVNAAGAWASRIGGLAGASDPGLRCLRRTAVLVDPPAGADIKVWPFVVDLDEEFYFKPDAGRLLLCPGDETESEPCDAQPEELDIAIAIDRIQKLADIPVRRVVRAWAGLRTFAPDRSPVVGYDSVAPDFFWLAGQGGFGIQTAPALGRAAASLLRDWKLPPDLSAMGLTEQSLSPARFRINDAQGPR